MIVEALISVVFGVINFMLNVISVLHIPDMPPALVAIGDQIISMLKAGTSFVMYFFNHTILIAAITIAIIAHNADHLYSVVRWICSKLGMNFD